MNATNTRQPLLVPASALTTTNNTLLHLPAEVRQSLTSALFTSPSSIPAIQKAFSSSIASSGLGDQLEAYVLETFRHDPDHVVSEPEMLENILEKVRHALVKETGKGRADETSGTSQDRTSQADTLLVPNKVTEAGSKVVRQELRRIGVKIEDDEGDWL